MSKLSPVKKFTMGMIAASFAMAAIRPLSEGGIWFLVMAVVMTIVLLAKDLPPAEH